MRQAELSLHHRGECWRIVKIAIVISSNSQTKLRRCTSNLLFKKYYDFMIIISVYMCMCVQAHTFHPAFRQGLSCFFCCTKLQTSWPASFWLALLSLPPILQIHTSASSIWCGCCGLNSVIKCFYFLSHLLGTTPSLVIESQMTHFHLCVCAWGWGWQDLTRSWG